MRKIIIITHKTFADGLKDSLVFFTNMENQIVSISAYEHGDNEFPQEKLQNELSKVTEDDQVFILTDLLGGSVNQKSVGCMNDQIFVITGINLPVALEILLSDKEKLNDDDIEEIVENASKQLIFMNRYSTKASVRDE